MSNKELRPEKRKGDSKATLPKTEAKKPGAYLRRKRKGARVLTDQDQGRFGPFIERGLVLGNVMQAMFTLRDAVSALGSLRVPPDLHLHLMNPPVTEADFEGIALAVAKLPPAASAPRGLRPAVPVPVTAPGLELLDEVGEAALRFVGASRPFMQLAHSLKAELAALDDTLKRHPVVEQFRSSLTMRQVVALYIALVESPVRRLEPRELVDFIALIERHLPVQLFEEGAPTLSAWREVFWAVRAVPAGEPKSRLLNPREKSKRSKERTQKRGALLSAVQAAGSKLKTPGR